MFCYQCEQTTRGTGCVKFGVCGKTAETADLQDVLVHATKRLATRVAPLAAADRPAEIAPLLETALFATLTNVNFDDAAILALIRRVIAAIGPEAGVAADADRSALLAFAAQSGIEARTARFGADVVGLQELLLYGLKGVAAYAHHARRMDRADPAVDAFTVEALARLDAGESEIAALLGLNLACGEASVKVLALLDAAHGDTFGKPTPTPVRIGHVPGKAILVSGHDLVDLKALLEQTEGTGIRVYTHGEMLPAHGYPELKKHAHLAGHFGGAWMRQQKEFATFPGPIVMTTNCLQDPDSSYADRLFTRDVVGWPGIAHLDGSDFSAVVAAALAAPGFADEVTHATHLVGFGHDAVLGVAGTVVDAVKSGAIKHFALIGGCDGSEGERSYYTDLATAMPADWMILTLGCGKFRLLGHDYGTVAGLPRLLDMGQCNDAFSAVKVAQALAGAFDCGINDLPLSLTLSWFEQKAVCVLLALLHLGVKNIRIGPKLPAFLTPTVLGVLVETFGLKPIGTVEDDIRAMATAA
ncbi:hydroxylamine reductase [Siculibacillus lacustris]|uniref:Hydroxylamine reductase n=1 Tax=Siculibacillus lacustris TaxID=1549641 RepID=A0A4Q9VWP4_9HYPH|nr:hydroxylamine reductase [Siculibacillus lacustris]TBW40294.1 hydroxylamine reductase [Siculibacillus lacustris]